MNETIAGPEQPAIRRQWLMTAVKLVIVVIVAVGIQQTLRNAWTELARQQLDLSYGWLVVSGLLYLAGLFPAAWFWFWLLRSLQQPVLIWETLRAHFIGHLGKYVPGKAMVFVIRVGMLSPERRTITAASLAVFYETIMLMAVGACLAAVILPFWYHITGLPAVVAVGCAVATALATLPPMLTRLGWLVRRLKPDWQLADALASIEYRHVIVGWCANLVVWLFFALSFWATLRAILPASQAPFADVPFFLAAVALAVVAGFASMIPGGALVREGMLIGLLDPRYGAGTAVVAAVVLRLVWLLSELLFSAILYPLGRKHWR